MKTPGVAVHELPAHLKALADTIVELAMDLRWTWSHAGDALWKSIAPQIWEQTENPFVVLQNLTRERLEELSATPQFRKRLRRLAKAREEYRSQAAWFGATHAESGLKGIAYFSMEFGLGAALHLYAGGLGVLAGDFLKAASDLGVPVIGIGLLYQEGYFRQMLDADGRQQEIYPYNDPGSMPIRPVFADSGGLLHIYSDFPGRKVRFRVWQAQVGRVSLYLLDSNDPLNSPGDRGITSKLYGGGEELRLVQEIALGVCGWRLIEALDLPVDICHLNEGHAAFATLERARRFMDRQGVNFGEALWATRPGNVFTTHTPVAAGFDTYDPALILKYGRDYTRRLGLSIEEIGALGRRNPHDDREPFNVAYLAMRTCGITNGVSRLHGQVSRRIFQDLYPRWPQAEVPVTHVTNGIHVSSWDSPWADKAWTEICGPGCWRNEPRKMVAELLGQISDARLWTFCGLERHDLVRYARRRLARQLSQRGEALEMINRAHTILDPNVLTLGFARRFAEYKRPDLLLRDPERLIRLLTNPQRPVQLIVAGKAHPGDAIGKGFVQEWARFVQRPEVRPHAVFLEDYDIPLAQELVQGVDLWLNTPRRPWEASGTSGMKVLANGGLNLSELDGWWAEAYGPDVGWALGDGQEHPEPEWDGVEAEQLYRLLEEEVVPAFYERDATGIPRAWISRMRASMARLAPQFSANRMVREYVEQVYLPAVAGFQQRTAEGGRLARELWHWAATLRQHWHELHWGNVEVRREETHWRFAVQVYLGGVPPEAVLVQLYAEAGEGGEGSVHNLHQQEAIPGAINGFLFSGQVDAERPATDYTPRVIPRHPRARIPTENNLILWWAG